MLDSITRLARAYNSTQAASGKILTGGVDANALENQKIFRGSKKYRRRRQFDDIATALIDTGSRMDEVIFEEFKGTGNQEIHLDRAIAEKKYFLQSISAGQVLEEKNLLLTTLNLQELIS